MIDWKSEFRRYANDLEAAWPEARHNQVAKLERFLSLAAEASGLDRAGVVDAVVKVAERRVADRPPTMFLVSCGSSGSHWLEAMLAEFAGHVACGEVYLPRPLLRETMGWDAAARSAFLDCVHLAHVPVPKPGLAGARLINSAHLSGWIMSRAMAPPRTRVLLLRDPVDIVVSRTYRKDVYRKFSLPDASDDEYLARNIEFVNTFFRKAAAEHADHVVKYEALRQDGEATLAALLAALGHAQDPPVVADVVRRHSAEAQAAARTPAAAGTKGSNYYRGPRTALPEGHREWIRARLVDEVAAFGY